MKLFPAKISLCNIVYLSSDHPFQDHCKVRQVLLQSATGITKYENFITKCDRTYPRVLNDESRYSQVKKIYGFKISSYITNNLRTGPLGKINYNSLN